jgi:hypothetical protein
VGGSARPLAIVGASAIGAVVAMAAILASTLPAMFRKPSEPATFFVDVRLFLAAWLGILIAYALIRASREVEPPADQRPSTARRYPRRSRIGLGLARAMMTFGITAPLIGVVLIIAWPAMARGRLPSPWVDVALIAGLAGLLVGMVWVLVTWRSFLDEL